MISFLDSLPERSLELTVVLLGLMLVGLAWARYLRANLERRESLDLGHRFLEALRRNNLGLALGLTAAHPGNALAHILESGLVMHLYQQGLRVEGARHDPLQPVRLAIDRARMAMRPHIEIRLQGFATLTFMAVTLGLLGSLEGLFRLLDDWKATGSLQLHPVLHALTTSLGSAVFGLSVLILGILVMAWMRGQARKNEEVVLSMLHPVMEIFEQRMLETPLPEGRRPHLPEASPVSLREG